MLPAHSLSALIAAFDANGDGCVSIPEFSAFMQGETPCLTVPHAVHALSLCSH